MSEPFVRDFVQQTVAGKGPLRILEIGCGSGALMRCAAQANPALTGVGLEIDPAVVEQARGNLELWGLDHRFEIAQGDVRSPPASLKGPFDLVTLYNLIYYFPVPERPALFAALKSLLAPHGSVVVVSSFQAGGNDPVTANLDLATRSLNGCWPLPLLEELKGQLQAQGYQVVRTARLIPAGQYYGVLATRGRKPLT